MLIAAAWLRIDLRRRWRSLVVLSLLIAVATATVLTAVAGAQRGHTAWDRLWARTLPATVTVLANQPGFDWAKIRALPEVTALTLFPVSGGTEIAGLPDVAVEFAPEDASFEHALERPVMLSGRLADPSRIDEVDVSQHFIAWSGKKIGDTLTLRLASTAQTNAGIDGSDGTPLAGPSIPVRIVGVVKSPWLLDTPGDHGLVVPSAAVFARYTDEILGTNGQSYSNALVRLAAGAAQIPRFRADLARVTGRSDIDVWSDYDQLGQPLRRIDDYDAACLLAFGLAALLAGLFLVGQSLARYVGGAVGELRVLQAVGLSRRQAVASAVGGPLLAALAGASLGVAGAVVASQWMPIGMATLAEPSPGISADWTVLGPGWALTVALAAGGAALLAWGAFGARARRAAGSVPRRSAVAGYLGGAPVPVVVGAQYALEPGRSGGSVPARSAMVGAVAGVLGVLAALTFSSAVSDAAGNPERYGETWQLTAFYGLSGEDFGPASAVSARVAADPQVAGFLDTLVGGGQSGQVSVETFTYTTVGGKTDVPVVMTAGRMPAAADEVVLAPSTAKALGAQVGSTVPLGGGAAQARPMTVTGIGFVPSGPHNSYDQGAWLTSAGYEAVFSGARYPFKFHLAAVVLRPGVSVTAAAQHLTAVAAMVKGGSAFPFGGLQADPEMRAVADVQVLPLALAAFLALLAVGAVGNTLAAAVRYRRRELAVLRTLGMTGRQARLIVVTQASVIAVIGLVAGIPLGILAGRSAWRWVAALVPLEYVPPLAIGALVLIAPAALIVANILGAWPAERAARLRPGAVLRTE